MDYDAIVIGSGIGGLTAAVALARAGRKVLVLEQHYLPGGWAHTFTLEGHSFSPGVHYVGELGEGESLRAMFEGLGLGPHLVFRELAPDGYDHLLVAGERLDVPRGRARWVERLTHRFPHHARGIERYFATLADVARELSTVDQLLRFPRVALAPLRAPALARWGFRTLDTLLDEHGISDPRARAFLAARCGNHGLAPSEVSLPAHAAMIQHYAEGAYYPRGGGRRIVSAFLKVLRAHGGELRVSTRVSRILVRRGRAVGVELEGGERIGARQVISNADATVTYRELLPGHAAPWQRHRAARMRPSVSALSLFVATDLDLASRGFDSGNYWFFRHGEVEAAYHRMSRVMPPRPLDAIFVSASSLKDPALRAHGQHTLEMFTFVPYAPFARWHDTTLGARGPAYEARKRELTASMLEAAERVIPGLRARVTFCELGTPLTNEFYCAAPAGACYGIAKTPFQVGPFAFSTRSSVRNLHLCGASTISHGVAGAALSGLEVARDVLGLATIGDCLSRPDGSLVIERDDTPAKEERPAHAHA